jgi:hypothetical protein
MEKHPDCRWVIASLPEYTEALKMLCDGSVYELGPHSMETIKWWAKRFKDKTKDNKSYLVTIEKMAIDAVIGNYQSIGDFKQVLAQAISLELHPGVTTDYMIRKITDPDAKLVIPSILNDNEQLGR